MYLNVNSCTFIHDYVFGYNQHSGKISRLTKDIWQRKKNKEMGDDLLFLYPQTARSVSNLVHLLELELRTNFNSFQFFFLHHYIRAATIKKIIICLID